MESPVDVWNRAFGAFEECSSILNPILPHQLTESPIYQPPPVALSWTAPPAGFLNINCDAALDQHNGAATVACVVRDDSGRIIKGETCLFPSWSISVAEAIAVRKGVLLAIEEAWDKVIFESDNQGVINGINSFMVNAWESSAVVKDILSLAAPYPNLSNTNKIDQAGEIMAKGSLSPELVFPTVVGPCEAYVTFMLNLIHLSKKKTAFQNILTVM
ncbi:hypothetical protein V6N13_017507 [Hibiscus sabdariffa]